MRPQKGEEATVSSNGRPQGKFGGYAKVSMQDILPFFLLFLKWLRSKPSSKKYIFITGIPRSGTTLLKIILMAHSKIGGIDGESTGIFKIRNFCKYSNGEISNKKMKLIFLDSRSFVEFYDKTTSLILKNNNGKVFVDKIWPNRLRFKIVSYYFPKSRWIVCIRDGRDCFCSSKKHPNIPQNKSIVTFAKYWKKCIKQIGGLPEDRTILVKYEDMVSAPETEIKKLMKRLSLDFEPHQISVKQYSKQTSIKKRNYHQKLSKPISSSSLSRWKNELTKKENDKFVHLAGKEMKVYGYE